MIQTIINEPTPLVSNSSPIVFDDTDIRTRCAFCCNGGWLDYENGNPNFKIFGNNYNGYYNANFTATISSATAGVVAVGLYEDDCVIRSISCATNRSWDSVYDELSDLAQEKGTLLDKKDFVRGYLNANFKRIDYPPYKVYQVAEKYKNNIVLCTMRGHIVCIKYGIIYDTFNPSDRVVEDVWIVK